MKINLSDEVWVQLTGFGKKQFDDVINSQSTSRIPREERSKIMEEYRLKPPHSDWYKFTLSELMTIFGSSQSTSVPAVFRGSNIHLIPPNQSN